MMIQRPFSSGSRQAPDPHDIFLEESGFYRKHTARDSSCLFRTISEQMYDTQNHHMILRESCVSYMRKNRTYFEKCLKQHSFDTDFDEYLDELCKHKTFGSLLELEAMSHMFARNVILFRPLELGQWFIYKPYVDNYFQVFVSNDRHFDTVYTNSFIADAAFCQSIVYELLYKHVFQLPDITYAVERMLHASSFEEISSVNEGMYVRKIYLKDGRIFYLDKPENTKCILNNHELCHFHNENFPQMAEMLHNEINKMENYSSYLESPNVKSNSNEFWSFSDETNDSQYFMANNSCFNDENEFYDCHNRLRQLDSLLPDKYISCVRQLLYEGITPFPYKVAKALDPDMYRNIEFDSWSEIRKEQRWKNWYTGGSNLQVGVKCQIYLRKQDEYFTGYIQEMPETQNGPCVVFIEDLGEKRTVSFDCLKPLPPDQAKPWPLPYRWQKQFEKYQQQQNQAYSPSKFFKRFLPFQNKYKMVEYGQMDIIQSYDIDEKIKENDDDINYKLKQYCSLDHFNPTAITTPIQIITMPLTIENERTPLSTNTQNKSNPIKSNKIASSGTANTNGNATEKNQNDSINYSSPDNQQGREQPQHQQINQQHQSPQTQLSTRLSINVQHQDSRLQFDDISANYDEDNNVPIVDTHLVVPGMNDGTCSYPVYNYYPEQYYPYHHFDNSIIHASTGGQQFYCVLPNSAAPGNIIPSTGQNNICVPSNNSLLSPSVACTSTGPLYHPAAPTYFPASTTILQPIVGQSIPSGRQIIPSNNTQNVNFAVQKSVLDSGIDLPNDIATLRFFFNLGWEYYHEMNAGKNKENVTENGKSTFVIEFEKLKFENESPKKDKADPNNNIITNAKISCENSKTGQNHSKADTENQNYQQQLNSNSHYTHKNNSKYNTGHHRNSMSGSSDGKNFTSRYFNNRKINNPNRGGSSNATNRYTQNLQSGRGNIGNTRTENRNTNYRTANSNITGNTYKTDSHSLKITNAHLNEPDTTNNTDAQTVSKNKEVLENITQASPISTTSDLHDFNQHNTQLTLSVSSYATSLNNDQQNFCSSEQFATANFSTMHNANNNGNMYMPQLITPLPIGMCPPVSSQQQPSSSTQPYNSFNFSYVTPGQQMPNHVNTSLPPPPLPSFPPQQGPHGGAPLQMQSGIPYSMQTPTLQQPAFYYPIPPPTQITPINTNSSDTSSIAGSGSNTYVGSNEINMVHYTPEPTGTYPFSMNFPVYYTPTGNGGLTPTSNNPPSGGQLPNHGGQMNGPSFQTYWLTPTPVQQHVAMTPPTANKTNHFSGNSNASH